MTDLTRAAVGRYGLKAEKLDIPTPPIGGKSVCLDRLGKFVLAEGPGIFRCIACTHGGSAHMTIYDGLACDPVHDRAVFVMRPVVLGHWMLDLGFIQGLCVELEGGMIPLLTIVWVEKPSGVAIAVPSKIQRQSA